MSTIALKGFNAPVLRVAAPAARVRKPRIDLTRHAALTDSGVAAAARFGLALVPFCTLAWLFVAF